MSGKQARYLAGHGMMRKSKTKAQINLRDQVKHPVLFPNTIIKKKRPDVNDESFPAPCTQDYKHRGPSSRQQGLSNAVKLRPAPKGSSGPPDSGGDAGKGEKQETFLKRMGGRTDACFQSLPAQVGGQLNAAWTEALMGYPRNWTDIEKDCPFENRYPEAWITGAWEDGVPRVITGQKNRPRRIKALGNSIVPQIPCLIFRSNNFDKWR